MSNLRLDRVEFIITNVCNLNCTNCNQFNNFAFTGHQYWNDYSDLYIKWSSLLTIDNIAILGGEPLLNPDLLNWIHGVAKLWPNNTISIVTNGTQFNRWPTLYQEIAQYKGRVNIELSHHNRETMSTAIAEIKNFLQGPITVTSVDNDKNLWRENYERIRDIHWPDCPNPIDFVNLPIHVQKECREIHKFSPEYWVENGGKETYETRYTDLAGVNVLLCAQWTFDNSTLQFDESTHTLKLHQSNPEKAINVCNFRNCHRFHRGKLYKCGPVGLLPEFIKQFPVDINNQERELINAYQPAVPSWSSNELQKFVQDLNTNQPIAQCTFCPEKLIPKVFSASAKKIKIKKLSNV